MARSIKNQTNSKAEGFHMNSSKRSKINFKGVALAAAVLAGSGATMFYPLSVLNFNAFALETDSEGFCLVSNEDELIEALTTGVTKIKLTNDIQITKTFSPASYDKRLSFFGQGHRIIGLKNSLFENLKSSSEKFMYNGEVGYSHGQIVIKDLIFEEPNIVDYSSQTIGVLAKSLSGDSHIENCHVIGGSVNGKIVGALIGIIQNGIGIHFQDCTSDATVTGTNVAGGLIGNIAASDRISFWGCISSGKVFGSANSKTVSGMIGVIVNSQVTIKDAVIDASVSAQNKNVAGVVMIGGARAGTNIASCVFTGSVDIAGQEVSNIITGQTKNVSFENIYYKIGEIYKVYGEEGEYSLEEIIDNLNQGRADGFNINCAWEIRDDEPYLVLSAETNGGLSLDSELLIGETDETNAKISKGVKIASVAQSGVSEIRQKIVTAALEKIEKKIGANSDSTESAVVEIPANPQSKITVDLGEQYKNKKVYVTCITDKGYFYRTDTSGWATYDNSSKTIGVTELGDEANIIFDGLNESMIFIITPAN